MTVEALGLAGMALATIVVVTVEVCEVIKYDKQQQLAYQ